MSDTIDPMRPIAGYAFRSFLVHKPVGVVSSTIDTGPTELIKKKDHPRCGLPRGVPARRTVYDIANRAGFPIDCGLVGRLDLETSGIMLFSNDTRLADAIRDPPKDGSPLEQSDFKTKEYELRLLSSIAYEPEEFFDLDALAEELAQPFTFQKAKETYYCGRANVRVLRRFRDEAKSRGRPNLGWCTDVRVIIREGKHHQIRRMAKRSGFHVVSLHRVSIASILKIESVPLPGQCRWLTLEEIETLYEGLLLNATTEVENSVSIVDDSDEQDYDSPIWKTVEENAD